MRCAINTPRVSARAPSPAHNWQGEVREEGGEKGALTAYACLRTHAPAHARARPRAHARAHTCARQRMRTQANARARTRARTQADARPRTHARTCARRCDGGRTMAGGRTGPTGACPGRRSGPGQWRCGRWRRSAFQSKTSTRRSFLWAPDRAACNPVKRDRSKTPARARPIPIFVGPGPRLRRNC